MSKKILIFGGSGFIGSTLTNTLLANKHEICVICTNKEKAIANIGSHKNLEIKTIDIFNEIELKNLLKNYEIIINLIGKLFETTKGEFENFHHIFPKILVKNISEKQHLIHISALGIEQSSEKSLYAQTKLSGQYEISQNCKNYNIIKPSIVFGQKDNFFNLFANMTKKSPFLPLIGGGKAKFAPVYVEDLNKTIIRLIEDKKYKNQTFEAYGPDFSTFKQLMQFILKVINKKRLLITLPFFVAKTQAKIMNLAKIYLITPDQVELLKYNNITSNKYNNIDKIIGDLKSYKEIVPNYLTQL